MAPNMALRCLYKHICAAVLLLLLQFPYICGVVNEALRLYPPGANTLRETGDDAFQLGPYSLPACSTVVVGTYVMHRDPAVWPHAAAFMPERWLPVSA
jgi:cytochrome P450